MNENINKTILRDIITEQKASLSKKRELVVRDIFTEVVSLMNNKQILIITGLRRTGKSTLLSQIMSVYTDNLYFSFEDERLIHFTAADFSLLHEVLIEFYGNHTTFFFDEIQNIVGWERFVRRLHDQGYKIVLTGSNATLLSKELGTKLTGRYVSVNLYPFSWNEFLSFHKITISYEFTPSTKNTYIQYFNTYMFSGGMPEYLITGEKQVLKHVYEDILYRDIVSRYNITLVEPLRILGNYLSITLGQLVSYNALKNTLKLGSVNTVKKFLEYLVKSYLFFTVSIYDNSPKNKIYSPKKIYSIDHGLSHSIGIIETDNLGKKLENIVYIELVRRGYTPEYYRDEQGYEIDFVVSVGNKVDLYQVTYTMDKKETRDRELRSIQSAIEKFGNKIRNIYIITAEQGEELIMSNKTVEILPAYRWLLK